MKSFPGEVRSLQVKWPNGENNRKLLFGSVDYQAIPQFSICKQPLDL